ncbi:TBP-related factor-like [Choristoneura fumiferana]|uniref:TBP-related factor-like n=1 Tax=Choristoneura fumiferana TaxID=7141 RepID=UPI003D1545AA
MEPTRENNLSLQDCLNNPIKRFTPSVPTPVWDDVENRTTLVENDMFSPPPPPLTQPALSHSLNSLSGNMTRTPIPRPESVRSDNSVMSVPTPQAPPRISGDVALTPTHSAFTPQANPHSSMAAVTPMASGTSQAKNSIKIQNCVSTVSLGCELKLLDIYCRTRFSEYNPARFQGVVMKILEPRVTALVFRLFYLLCNLLIAKFLDFKIQNFIATGDLRFPVRLEALQQAHGQFTSYEPELFPGLVYRMVRPRVVLLIFVNGKIVFTGGKTRNDIHEALDIIYPILRSYRKN